jgi:signal transduction histidine kinase
MPSGDHAVLLSSEDFGEGGHMLHEFVTANRAKIIERCRSKIAIRPAPRPTEAELERGVPLFLDQLVDALRVAESHNPEIAKSGATHGGDLLREGFTVAQVVQDYGRICQTISELAVETAAHITAREFKILNACLDDATAEAVTEYARLREYEGTERIGRVVHELRGLLHSAGLAFERLKSGSVGVGGSTGALLDRSLAGLRTLVDREFAEARLGAGVHHKETIVLRQFIDDMEIAATLDASARQLQLSVVPVAHDIVVYADREVLASVVMNLLRNAFKFTRPNGHVMLRAYADAARVHIAVEDQCGGLPAGKVEELFKPFEQRGTDRSGLGLGLSICRRGARVNDGEIHVRDVPGTGCVFTVDLPRVAAKS